MDKREIEHRFGFHKATIEGDNATLPKHRDIRLKFREFAAFLDSVTPDGRAKDVMFTELETASMWAHKAVAELAPVIQEPVARLVDHVAHDHLSYHTETRTVVKDCGCVVVDVHYRMLDEKTQHTIHCAAHDDDYYGIRHS